MSARDFTGLRFGMLEAIRPAHSNRQYRLWLFRCDCGTEKIMRPDKVASGRIKSCGCGPRSGGGGGIPPNVTGRRKWGPPTQNNRTYRSWAGMIERCTNPRSDGYKYYGASGISVCERWKSSFGDFLADMGERPEGTTIDRWPDPAGNYEPTNCRWATTAEQGRNKRKWGTVAAEKFPKRLP